jgi:hypothetical protein
MMGVVGASGDGLVFDGVIVEGIHSGNGLFIDHFSGIKFSHVFAETAPPVASPPTVIKVNSSHLIDISVILVSNPGWGKMLEAIDMFQSTFRDFVYGALNIPVMSSVGFSGTYPSINSLRSYGDIVCYNCGYQINQSLKNQPGVVLQGPDLFPGSFAMGTLTGVPDIYGRVLQNRQGAFSANDTDWVLDAFHGQDHFSTDDGAKVVTDASASRGKAVQNNNNTLYAFRLAYPSQIGPGAYELIGRVNISAGTSPIGWLIYGVDDNNNIITTISGNVFGSNATTTYQTFSARFSILSTNLGGGVTHILAGMVVTPGAGQTWNLDYFALRPANNDWLCQPYVKASVEILDNSPGYDTSRVSCATAQPSAGFYKQGDFVYNLNPGGATATVLLGWYRLTNGNTHTLGVDWAAITGPWNIITASPSLNFPNTDAGSCSDLATSVPGAGSSANTTISVTAPSGIMTSFPGASFTGYLSAMDTVTVRFCNTSSKPADPGTANYWIEVRRF